MCSAAQVLTFPQENWKLTPKEDLSKNACNSLSRITEELERTQMTTNSYMDK